GAPSEQRGCGMRMSKRILWEVAAMALLLAQTALAQQDSIGAVRTVGVCAPIENSDAARGTAQQTISPDVIARAYMRGIEHRPMNDGALITALTGPAHGSLQDLGQGAFRYTPHEGYVGPDRATLLAEGDGLKIKLVYFFNVLEIVSEDADGYSMFNDKKM